MTDSAPCPFCKLGGGFHDEDYHDALAARVIPDHLRLPTNTNRRAAEKAVRQAKYEAWLAGKAAS